MKHFNFFECSVVVSSRVGNFAKGQSLRAIYSLLKLLSSAILMQTQPWTNVNCVGCTCVPLKLHLQKHVLG